MSEHPEPSSKRTTWIAAALIAGTVGFLGGWSVRQVAKPQTVTRTYELDPAVVSKVVLGEVDFNAACVAQHPELDGAKAVLIAPYDAGSWKCASQGKKLSGDKGLDLNRACSEQYGGDGEAHTALLTRPEWVCVAKT